MDKGIIEKFGATGLSYGFAVFTKISNFCHSGYIYHYLLIIFCFIILVSFFTFFNIFTNNIFFLLLPFSYSFFVSRFG